MNYLEWNKIIAGYFFKPENAGKNVYLYLTIHDLVRHAKQYLNGFSDDEIWIDFVEAIKYDYKFEGKFKILASPIETPLQLFNDWNKIDIPPFIAYLILYIIPLTETYEEQFSVTNYYGKVNKFFEKYCILKKFDQKIGTSNFCSISHLWDALEEWSILTQNCDLGIFELKQFGNPNWIYVGKPFSQCVLPPSAINKLPELFYEAGMIPNSIYSQEYFKKVLLKYSKNILNINDRVVELIRKSDTNELGLTIIEITKRQYDKWTGETVDEEEVIGKLKRKKYTVAALFLQFKLNYNDERICFSYRLFSSNEFPEDLKFGDFENLYERNNWSKTMIFEFGKSFELEDDFNKWIARFPEKEIRLFINAGTQQLSTDYWIETPVLSRTDQMFLLCSNNKKHSIIDWGKTFRDGNFIEEEFEGLPEGYSLFNIKSPLSSHPDIPSLKIHTEKKIILSGGLKISFRIFTNDFLPYIEIINSDGNEKVYLQYKNNEEKVVLRKKQYCNNCWLLPDDVLLDSDFYIRVEDESLVGNETAYRITSSNDSALLLDGDQQPKRDSFGELTQTELSEYCIGNNIIGSLTTRQGPYLHLFKSTNKDTLKTFSQTAYVQNAGNLFISFLTAKKINTTEEFYKAFECIYSKQFSECVNNENFNLTKLKKASLNFYEYLGFFDYDYESKKIVINPLKLIYIPSTKGRRVLLIGGRDYSTIQLILDTALKHNLQTEVTKQFASNENLLLPDVITFNAFGKSSKNFGEGNLNAFAEELGIAFNQSNFLQVGLQLFSADIDGYERKLLLNNETSKEDYGWARKIFNPETLRYEKSVSESFDKSFSLIEYKLNEYTIYYKLWKDDKCYSVDKNWGKYLALKYSGKQCILYDNSRNKVAIPLELPLPRLLAKSIMLSSGLASAYSIIENKQYRVYENIPNIFIRNLFTKLKQEPIQYKL